MKSRLEVQSNYGKGSRFSFKIHLPIAPVMNGLQPSPYPFPQDILKLDQATREYMMSELRARRICISASEEDFLLAERLKTYLQGWDLSFISADKVLTQPCENIRNIHLDCEIVILNDSVDDLRTLLEAFPEYYNKDNPGISNGRQQKTMFFSCVAEYQAAENLLRKYCPFSVVVVTKPAGPSKILEALLKASHWLTCPSDATKPFAPHFIEHACRELLETVFNHPRPKAEVPLEFRTWSPETCSEASFLQGRDEDSGRQRGDEIHMEEITEGKEIQDAEITRRVEEVERNFLFVAIDKFEGQSFDVIFMDLQMPILDGASTPQLDSENPTTHSKTVNYTHPLHHPVSTSPQIRKIEAERHEVSNTASNLTSPKQRRAIIIAMTGLAAAEDREAAMSAGCDEFLTK
ncbi:hypothetical protein BC938DRAFT_481827 [Jimgerdemannia flammicorona]|uniref:Response regulatory domain-containing protein n=1 Tax=Jimgerdemannia flammicorona TaxID=994334 RepID=A0A433QFA1_9FUNG|nr:hypothetical protein BC938DRAFT_481827 [Jimgerdemannia flammicorona]